MLSLLLQGGKLCGALHLPELAGQILHLVPRQRYNLLVWIFTKTEVEAPSFCVKIAVDVRLKGSSESEEA